MKFLIADDDPVSRVALCYLVSELSDAEVIQAVDGDSAWLALQDVNEPVISLLDNRMPGMNGVEVLKKMRQSLRYLGWPVMLVTGTADRGLVTEAVQFGVSGFVLKPVGDDALERISDVAVQFEHSILAPLSDTATRLDTSHSMVQAYVQGLIKQLDVLVTALGNLTDENLPLVRKKIETCRSAAAMLGSHHLEMVLDKLASPLDDGETAEAPIGSEAILLARNRISQMASIQ